MLLEGEPGLTRTGETLGTPSYMAPEQVRGNDAGTVTDVYALGAILDELLTGRPPFANEARAEVLTEILANDPAAPRRLVSTIPRDLETIALKCLEKNPLARYRSAGALADDLGRFLAGRPTLARPRGPAARVLKWSRRRPAAASLLIVVLAATLALAGGGLWHMRTLSDRNARLTQAIASTRREYERAESNERAAHQREEVLRLQRYGTSMKLAQETMNQGSAATFRDLMPPYRDGSEDAHLRGFEWYYLWGLGHSALRTRVAHTQQVNWVV